MWILEVNGIPLSKCFYLDLKVSYHLFSLFEPKSLLLTYKRGEEITIIYPIPQIRVSKNHGVKWACYLHFSLIKVNESL